MFLYWQLLDLLQYIQSFRHSCRWHGNDENTNPSFRKVRRTCPEPSSFMIGLKGRQLITGTEIKHTRAGQYGSNLPNNCSGSPSSLGRNFWMTLL